MNTQKKNYTFPIIVCFFMFAMISFVTGFQNPFGVILKSQLSLSNVQSQLGNLANFIAYLFMGLPAGMILKKRGYKFSALAAVILGLAGVCLMFVSSFFPQAQKDTIFLVYLCGAFVAGFSMCMLNTVVNPLLNTLGGGGKSGNTLLQFGGATNSLAATICPVLVGYLMGNDLAGCTLIQARPALYIAMGIFAFAFIVLMFSRLPEPILEEERAKATRGEKTKETTIAGAFRFRHFVLGIVAIFLYVGIEVGIPNFANLYMTTDSVEIAQGKKSSFESRQPQSAPMIALEDAADAADVQNETLETPGMLDQEKLEYEKASKIVSGELHEGLGMNAAVAGSIVGTYWFLMLVGRLLGGVFSRSVTSRKMLAFTSLLGIAFLLCALGFDGSTSVKMPIFNSDLSFGLAEVSITILFLTLCGLCTSVMWGCIFNLAVEGLGKYTAIASGLFMVMVCGGGILPLLQGWVADISGYMASYWVLIVALAFILFYALVGSKVTRKAD